MEVDIPGVQTFHSEGDNQHSHVSNHCSGSFKEYTNNLLSHNLSTTPASLIFRQKKVNTKDQTLTPLFSRFLTVTETYGFKNYSTEIKMP